MIAPGRLAEVRSFDDLLVFLTEDLDWPIGNLDLEDAAFDYEPEELGIDPGRAPRLAKISELRPLTANQPWGIFFLEFAGQRLPIGELRRVLDRLITKKRRSGGDGTLRSWALHDLLFLVTTDSGDNVELHLVAFRNVGDPTPEIRSLPWRPDLSPHQHLTRMETELLPLLAWPEDPSDSEAWREQWNEAFKLRHGVAITTATELATRMADVAQHLRDLIDSTLGTEDGHGPFSVLLKEVREELVADVDHSSFADMCAQTLVYGVLTARVTDPSSFGASPLLSTVPLANPFLAAFFEQVHHQVLAVDLDVEGLESLVADLRDSQIEAVLDQFGAGGSHADPVVHFYEEFLKQYDSSKRMAAGAFYTPQPVVRFMLRAVDEILNTRFGLVDGVADDSTWAEVADHNGFDVPNGIDPNSAFISMVDPATGTGTYLIEWMRQAHESFTANHPESEWPAHLAEQVLPSMHGFELMLGPYAIAHLKLALETHRFGIDMDPNTVLLTDTLDHPGPQPAFDLLEDPIAAEGQRTDQLKTDNRFTICIGNPPYGREQHSPTANVGKRQGGAIRHGAPGLPPLLGAYITPLKEAGEGKHAKNLYNLYVYFWRWATWQTTELPQGPGISAFITASSFLDGKSFAGMRQHLREHFDEILVIDLGGEGRGARTEENVFDILTPVAIAICLRRAGHSTSCQARYVRIEGSREEKFAALEDSVPLLDRLKPIEGSGPSSLVPTSDSPYYDHPKVSDLFPWLHSGCQVKRTWPIGPSDEVLRNRWDELCGMRADDRPEALRETGARTVLKRVKGLFTEKRLTPVADLKSGVGPEDVIRYGYRSFDRAFILADKRVIDAAKEPLWRASGTHQIFLTTLTSTVLGSGPGLTVTPYVPDLDHFRGSYGAKNVMPLWRDRSASLPNLTTGLLDHLSDSLGSVITAEDFAAYVYGVAGTPAYTARFFDELGEGAGPIRIPLTADPVRFKAVAALGRDLLWWHTWGERFIPTGVSELPSGSVTELEPVTEYPNDFNYSDGTLHVGTGQFGPVAQEVWDFEVSGLQVVKSWLGYRMWDRKGRKSSPLDDIRPEAWTFSEELLLLLSILEHTVNATPKAAELLEQVLEGPLIRAEDLPTPIDAERKAPRT
ncbi:MAG: hypothetical protein HN750_14975 [Gemmatimonadales bacterium]|nr:hypothetical protein [Gemmatimonadales bacterium]